MANEREYRIMKLSRQFLEMARQYKQILALAGLQEQDLLRLLEVLDTEGMTDVTCRYVLETDKDSVRKSIRNARNGLKYLAEDKDERLRLGRKAFYLNELEADEVNRLAKGYHVALCMTLLCAFIVK